MTEHKEITVTGGPVACYLDADTRSKVWNLAGKLGIAVNELVKSLIVEGLKKRGVMRPENKRMEEAKP